MARMEIRKMGKGQVPLRNFRKCEIVDIIFIDEQGKKHKGRFAVEDLRKALKIRKKTEAIVSEVSEFCGFE